MWYLEKKYHAVDAINFPKETACPSVLHSDTIFVVPYHIYNVRLKNSLIKQGENKQCIMDNSQITQETYTILVTYSPLVIRTFALADS